MCYVVNVGYDDDERRYFVLSSDIDGLHVEASTFEEFAQAARELVPALVGKIGNRLHDQFQARTRPRLNGELVPYALLPVDGCWMYPGTVTIGIT